MNFTEKGMDHTAENINGYCRVVHEANAKWWACLDCRGTGLVFEKNAYTGFGGKEVTCLSCKGTGKLSRNVGELLCLVHSEISEALEGHRKNLMDDKLPHRKMIEVELADTIIRIFDLAAGLDLDLGGAFVEKMIYNAKREDHKLEHRMGEHGKKY